MNTLKTGGFVLSGRIPVTVTSSKRKHSVVWQLCTYNQQGKPVHIDKVTLYSKTRHGKKILSHERIREKKIFHSGSARVKSWNLK